MEISTYPPAQPYLKDADIIDVKHIDGEVSLRVFVARFLSYYPWWIRGLYTVRSVFVRFLGMKQPRFAIPSVAPEDVSFEKDGYGTIFTVKDGREEEYWFAGITEKYLTADVLIIKEPINQSHSRFYTITVVHYHHWTGRVYFNVIRPFHHIVVKSMMAYAVKRDDGPLIDALGQKSGNL